MTSVVTFPLKCQTREELGNPRNLGTSLEIWGNPIKMCSICRFSVPVETTLFGAGRRKRYSFFPLEIPVRLGWTQLHPLQKLISCRCWGASGGRAMSHCPLSALQKLVMLRKPLLKAAQTLQGKTSPWQLQGHLHGTRIQFEKTSKQRNTASVWTSLLPQH